MKKSIVAIFIFFMGVFLQPAFSWDVIKTDHFTVFYKSGYENQAKEFLSILEYYRPKAEWIVGNNKLNVPIVIEDIGTLTNGTTDSINNRIFLFTYPPSASSLGTSLENWTTEVGIHEYTHLLHLSKTGGLMDAIKTIFGNYFMPNEYSLGWAVEGITVYTESQLSPYQGRLNDGYYDSYIASRVKDGRFPSILEAAYSPLAYPYGDGIYNYGGVFFEYLSKTYGEDKFARFFDNYGSSLPIFMFGLSAKQVYGKSFPKLWDEWRQYETERFEDFQMEGEKMTDKGWYASNLVLYNGKIYYIRNCLEKIGAFDPYGLTRIMEKDISTGEERVVLSTTSSFLTPIKIHDGMLYYTVAEAKKGYANVSYATYGIYSILHEKNLMTGDDKICLKDGIRDFDILDNGNILYSKDKKDSFGSEIIIFDKKTKEKNKLFDSDYLVDNIVIKNNHIIVSARKDWANYSLYKLDLDNRSFIPLVNNPRFEGFHSVCDDKVFFAANYGEVYSSYCYDLSSGKTYRLTQNGFSTYPVYDAESNILYYIGLNSYGYDIYSKPVEWNEYQIPDEPATIPPDYKLDESLIRKGSYFDNLKTLFPNLRIPLYYYDQSAEESRLGAIISGQDTLGHFPYSAELWYDFMQKKPLYDLTIAVNILNPLSTSISAKNIDKDKELAFNAQYPLLFRMNQGLTNLDIGLSAKTYNESESDSFDRAELNPYISSTFSFPKTIIGLSFGIPIERKNARSRIDRTAFVSDININRYIKKSALYIKAKGIYDPDSTYDPEKDEKEYSPFPVIRGYDDPLNTKIGASISADLTAPLIPLRFGVFLTPYIFFEDICADLFFDASFPKDGKNPQMSTGLELHLETNAAVYLPLDFGIRFVINKDKDYSIEPFLNLGF